MINVLHIVAGLNLGGAESLLVNLLKENKSKNNVTFHFLCYGNERKFYYTDEILEDGGRIHFIDYLKPSNFYEVTKQINTIINVNDINVVHSHTALNSAMVSLVIRKKSQLKMICHSHSGGDNNLSSSFIRKAYNYCSKIIIKRNYSVFISCSNEASRYLFSHVSDDKIIYFNNSINVDQYIDSNVPDEKSSETINFFTLGRLEAIKNTELAINVYSKLHHIQKSNLYIIGDGSEKNGLKNIVKNLGISDSVFFLGNRNDIPSLLNKMDIHLMPSILEGFPLTLLETQASSCRSFISDTIDESVDLGLGLVHFINIQDEKSWVNEIKKFFRKKEVLPNGEILSKFKNGNYDSSSSYEKLVRIYIDNQ